MTMCLRREFCTKFFQLPLSTVILYIPEFPYHGVRRVEGSPMLNQNQLDRFIRFDRTPTCDRRTDGRTQTAATDRHWGMTNNGISIASRGKTVLQAEELVAAKSVEPVAR